MCKPGCRRAKLWGNQMKMFAALFVLISMSVYGLLVGVPAINGWERSHNYPFGKMCDLDHSCPATWKACGTDDDGRYFCTEYVGIGRRD
jgi:hypothetical protein